LAIAAPDRLNAAAKATPLHILFKAIPRHLQWEPMLEVWTREGKRDV
jgi:hypothetical protein